jgi:hypothetical protein
MLHRYPDMQFVMNLDVEDFLKLAAKAVEKQVEERVWQEWLAVYPDMVVPRPGSKKPPLQFISFNKYLARLKSPKMRASTKTNEEIAAQTARIRAKLKAKQEGG